MPEAARTGLSPEWLQPTLHLVANGLEVAGVAVIVLAALGATAIAGVRLARERELAAVYHQFRRTLAHGILLGLEFLVAADIVGTVLVRPTLENLLVLGLLILIRTFLSFSLQVEADGRWPWQKRAP